MQGDRRDDDGWAARDEEPGRIDPLATPPAPGPYDADAVSRDAAFDRGEALPLGDDAADTRPWLEAAGEPEDAEVSSTKLALLGLLGLLIIASIVGGLWHLQSGGRKGREELIAAQPGDYKVRPADSNAKKFEGEGAARYAASEGLSPSGRVDPARVAEDPAIAVASADAAAGKPAAPAAAPAPEGPAATTGKAPATAGSAAPAATAPAAMASAATVPAGSAQVQLGAFGSAASAQKSWAALQSRFAWLQPYRSAITPVTRDGKTVHRLRVVAGTTASADALCQRLKVAGETCIRVD